MGSDETQRYREALEEIAGPVDRPFLGYDGKLAARALGRGQGEQQGDDLLAAAEADTKRAALAERVHQLERWRAAALWRRAMLERLDAAAVLLAEAEAGAPISVERVIVRRVLATLAQARRECASGLRTSEARAAELEAGSDG